MATSCRNRLIVLLAMCTTVVGAAIAAESPVLSEKALTRVSDHVWAIMGFPNVGIIVGDRATLVVDTGLGPRNGALVARVARGLSNGSTLYLTTTHFHPEHAAGEGGFPKGTILIRPRIQEEELEAHAEESLARFRTNPDYAPLLEGATFRKPDIVFDKDYTLDLGNVHVQLMWLGPAHTKGDEEIFVIEDRTLLPGDVAMKNRPPRNFAEGSSPEVWIGILDRLAALKPLHLVPDHGELGDASIIADDRTYLQSLGTAPH